MIFANQKINCTKFIIEITYYSFCVANKNNGTEFLPDKQQQPYLLLIKKIDQLDCIRILLLFNLIDQSFHYNKTVFASTYPFA